MQFDMVVRTVTELLEREAIEYAIIGGLAVQAWGFSRFTQDADIVVRMSAKQRVLALVESIGYETFHVAEGYSNHEHPDADFGRLDFMYVDDATADKLFSRAVVRRVIGDIEAPVPRPEHIIAMKVLAIKNAPRRVWGEMKDIQHLLKVPDIDRDEVREYFVRNGLLRLYDDIKEQT